MILIKLETDKHIRRFLISIMIRMMQVKSMRYYFIPIELAGIKSDVPSVGEMLSNGNS